MESELYKCLPNFKKIYNGDFDVYFHKTIKFLSNHQWIYDFKLTEFFSSEIIKNIPKEWSTLTQLSYDDMKAFVNGDFEGRHFPESLKNYVNDALKLSFNRKSLKFEDLLDLSKDIERGISNKKKYEIRQMATLVNRFSNKVGSSHLIDVGSGLGYLDQILHHNYGYKILGLEAIDFRIHKAEERYRKQGCKNGDGIKHKKFTLQNDTSNNFADIISELQEMQLPCGCESGIRPSDKSKIMMIGLHCCGDLTPSMIKLFLEVPEVEALCVVGCCYHFMAGEGDDYTNFPMSKRLKDVMLTYPEFNLSVFGLRLASQSSKSTWLAQDDEDHRRHIFNVSYRAILQVYANKRELKLVKKKRKGAAKSDYESFHNYLDAILLSYNIADVLKHEDFRNEMMAIKDQFENNFNDVEFITALQVLMQPVLEALIIVDRCCYLEEHGIDAKLVPIFDDTISPRNMALVAFKPL